MKVPLTVRIINAGTGEILHTNVINDFVPDAPEFQNKLYSYCDCLCRGIQKLDHETLRLEFYVNRYPLEMIF